MISRLFLVFAIIPAAAHAVPYRCGGLVQNRPCGQPFSHEAEWDERNNIPAPVAAVPRAQMRSLGEAQGDPRAQVLDQSFVPLKAGIGQWRGHVRGDGLVQLWLEILRNQVTEEVNYIGKVLLTPNDRSVAFHYQAMMPTKAGWSWRIRAVAGS